MASAGSGAGESPPPPRSSINSSAPTGSRAAGSLRRSPQPAARSVRPRGLAGPDAPSGAPDPSRWTPPWGGRGPPREPAAVSTGGRAGGSARAPAPPSPWLGPSGLTSGQAPAPRGEGGPSRAPTSAAAPPSPRPPAHSDPASRYGTSGRGAGRGRDFRRRGGDGGCEGNFRRGAEVAAGLPAAEARSEAGASGGSGSAARRAAGSRGRVRAESRCPACPGPCGRRVVGNGRAAAQARLAGGVGGHGGGRAAYYRSDREITF